MPPLESDPESPQPGPTGQGLSAPQAPERAPARNVFDPFRELFDMIKNQHFGGQNPTKIPSSSLKSSL